MLAVAAGIAGCGAASPTMAEDQTGTTGAASDGAAVLDRDLSLGSQGADVRVLNDYLTRYGYLPNIELQKEFPAWRSPVAQSPASPDRFDEATSEAVRLLQTNFGLPVTGDADAATRALLSADRCGDPDNVQRLDRSEKFDGIAGQWGSHTNLTIQLKNVPIGVPFSLEQARQAVMSAASLWSTYTHFTFTRLDSGTADITLDFNDDSHDCDGGTIGGYARTAPFGAGVCITFNTTTATWRMATPTPSGTKDFQSIALHELGHALGLGHSGYPSAVMYPDIPSGTQRRSATNDDVVACYAFARDWSLFDSFGEVDVDVDDGSLFYTRYVTAQPTLPSGELSVWRFTNGGPWFNMSGSSSGAIGGQRISSDPSAGTWLVQSNGNIYSYNSGTSWTKRPGCATDIAVGSDGSIWSLGCSKTSTGNYIIYKWNGSGWTKDPASVNAVRISIGTRLDYDPSLARIVPWIAKANGNIYRRSSNDTNSGGTWDLLPGVAGAATDIAANASGYTWSISNTAGPGGYTVQVWNEQPAANIGFPTPPAKQEWDTVPGQGINIAASSSGTPLMANDRGELFTF